MPIDETIAQTIMGDLAPETASARVSCHTVASRCMTCRCGQIFDEETITVARVRTPRKRVTQGFCPACWAKIRDTLVPAMEQGKFPFTIETWDGLQASYRGDDV